MFIYSASVRTSHSNHIAAVNAAQEPDVYSTSVRTSFSNHSGCQRCTRTRCLQCQCPHKPQQSHSGCQRCTRTRGLFTVQVSAQTSAITQRLSTVHEDPMFIYSASVRTNVGNHTAVVSSARGPDVYRASVRTSLSNHTVTVNGARSPDACLRCMCPHKPQQSHSDCQRCTRT